jgi:hypothetical protein
VSNEAGNFAAYRFNDRLAQILKLRARGPEDLVALSHAVSSGQPSQRVMVLNEPAESALVNYALSAGWNEPFKQFEMRLPLR